MRGDRTRAGHQRGDDVRRRAGMASHLAGYDRHRVSEVDERHAVDFVDLRACDRNGRGIEPGGLHEPPGVLHRELPTAGWHIRPHISRTVGLHPPEHQRLTGAPARQAERALPDILLIRRCRNRGRGL
ncbi:hypothetical protein [Leptolyngbya sp. 7M]|uniref:hypothetical protein n=1 Tax=Leptolyngbya sp. 7M TaxID=2812896 RepID=UPI001B8CB7FD|nr:hypothetical protein [Leptolyngbya sp. 7M]QYO63739.1 hypothetical protein JVX88_28420 [Leptolyngbya sp. 7M]